MSTILLVYRGDDGKMIEIPFAYRDGEMSPLAEQVADVIVSMTAVDSFWEGVAADRKRTILEQRVKLKEQSDVIAALRDGMGVLAL